MKIKFPFKLSRRFRKILIVVGLTAAMSPMVLLFQNASYIDVEFDPVNLANYYETMTRQCVAVNHTSCQGEVSKFTYQQGPVWGQHVQPNGYTVPTTYNSFLFSPKAVSRKTTYRSTGIYSTQWLNFDLQFLPLNKSEYSYAYNPSFGGLAGNALRSTSYTYYSNLSPISGQPEGLLYNIIGQVLSETIDGVGVKANSYLASGKLASVQKYGVRTDYTYDLNGNLASESKYKDGIKYTAASYGNYKRGIAQLVSKPLSQSTSRVVNDDGKTVAETDGLGRTTYYEYDLNLREKSITYPSGVRADISYPDENTKVIQKGYSREVTTHDVLGRVVETRHSDTNDPSKLIVKLNRWDEEGRLVWRSQPGWGAASSYGESITYDVLNRVISTARSGDGATTTFSYTYPDRATVVKPLGYQTTYRYYLSLIHI